LLDLQCSGADAPIVTPYRSSTHRQRQKCPGPTLPSRESGFVPRTFAAIGVHELIFDFRGQSTAESIERLQRFAAEVAPLTTG